jgi:hypothetical protein
MVADAQPRSKASGTDRLSFPRTSSGFALEECERYFGIGTIAALPEKTVDLAHRQVGPT